MKQHILSGSQAKKIILHAAGLSRPGQFGKGIEAVYKLIDHLGFLQIDTNYVVERAHHHIIASRVPDYKPEWIDELLTDGHIFEYFTYAAGYIPMHEYRFSLPVKESFLSRRKPLTPPEISLMKKVMDSIGREGPQMVKDFESDRPAASTGWWDWRPAKIALERLFLDGSLMCTRQKNFHKVYDLPINLIPKEVDTTMPTPEAYARYVILRSLQGLGIANAKDIAWRANYAKDNLVKKELEKMVAEGEAYPVTVEGLNTAPLFMLPIYKNKKITLSDHTFILSPFDPLNVHRHRLKDFFDFDYQIECFVPLPKRKYGYFSLPILSGDTFVARMDAKAERKHRTLTIHNLHFESVKPAQDVLDKVVEAIKIFAAFNQCREVVISKANNKHFIKAML